MNLSFSNWLLNSTSFFIAVVNFPHVAGKNMNLKLHVYIYPCKGRSVDKFNKLIKKNKQTTKYCMYSQKLASNMMLHNTISQKMQYPWGNQWHPFTTPVRMNVSVQPLV